MKLVIDIGNTNVKLGVFSLFSKVYFTTISSSKFEKTTKQILCKYRDIDKIILVSVSNLDISFLERTGSNKEVLILDHNFEFPFVNNYESPKTVGLDRLVLISAAYSKFPGKNVLVIDAGTCITFDFIDSNHNYNGGSISPGLNMRYMSLNEHTNKLPLLNPKLPKDFKGVTTDESIHSGVVFGIINEIDGVIELYNKKYDDLTVVLTGGDADFLSKQLKSTIFVFSNFLLEGLNFLLESNSKK